MFPQYCAGGQVASERTFSIRFPLAVATEVGTGRNAILRNILVQMSVDAFEAFEGLSAEFELEAGVGGDHDQRREER